MHIITCFKQFEGVLTVNAVHSRWLIGAFNASIPLMLPSTQQEDSDESESKDVAVENTNHAIAEESSVDSLFDEVFEALCSQYRKQKLSGVNASHLAALKQALCIVQEACGERRIIDSSVVQVSDIH